MSRNINMQYFMDVKLIIDINITNNFKKHEDRF